MPYDITQIITHFPKDLYDKGKSLANDKAVHGLTKKNQGIVISGRVLDENEHHRVFININLAQREGLRSKPQTLFEGECSCDLGENCEHVVATLIAAITPELISDTAALESNQANGEWLDTIRSQQRTVSTRPSLNTFYCLHLTNNSGTSDFGQARLSLEVFVAKSVTRPDTHHRVLTEKTPLFLDQHITAHPPRHVLPIDAKILKTVIKKSKRFELPNPVDISNFVESSFLQLLSQSGRCALVIDNDNTEKPKLTGNRSTNWIKSIHNDEEVTFSQLKNGSPKHLQPLWHINQRGDQWLSLNRPKQGISVFGAESPFYVDSHKNEWGLVGSPLSKEALQLINEGSILDPKDVPAFIQVATKKVNIGEKDSDSRQKKLKRIYDSFQQNNLPLPLVLQEREHRDIRPVPTLTLYSRRISTVVDNSYRRPAYIDGAALYFEYSISLDNTVESTPLRFHYSDRNTKENICTHGSLNSIYRQKDKEDDAVGFLRDSAPGLTLLHQLHEVDWTDEFNLAESHQTDFSFIDDHDWQNFLLNTISLLKDAGWKIHVESQFRHHFAKADSWYGDIQQTTSKWFDLEMGILVDGERINLLPILIQHIQDGNPLLSIQYLNQQSEDSILHIPINDGRIIPLPVQRIKRILSVFVELYETPKVDAAGKLQLALSQITRLGELNFDDALDDQNNILEWHGGKDLFEKAQQLRLFTEMEQIPSPIDLKATLRDYQKTGLNWLQFLRQFDLGGILADDMGLGKTLQALALILHEKQHGRLQYPTLVVAPTSVISNWRREAALFAPTLNVHLFHGSKRHQSTDSPFHSYQQDQRTAEKAQHDIIITSYALIHRDLEFWQSTQLSYVILDEAHHIKNRKTKVATSVRKLNAQHRLCLTGTPMENHLGELWSLFDFLMPKFLGNEKEFKKLYRNPIEKEGNEDRAEALSDRITPFLLRRTKAQVAKELPPKTEIIQSVGFNEAQQDLYESIRLSMHQKVRKEITKNGLNKSRLIILDALLKLRQVCCDPSLLKIEDKTDEIVSAKLELLMEMLPEMIEEGRRILLFSQFTSMLAIIEKRLIKSRIGYAKLIGSTRNRDEQIDRFQSKEVPLFLLSLKAGGVGLNLTAADTVIHYDPWWNPAAENQATDRAYRIGQDKPVFVYKLLVEHSVEETIFQMQKDKLSLVQSLYNDADDSELDIDKPFKLSGEELAALLQH